MQNKINIVREIKIDQEVTGINDVSAITELGPEKNEIRMTTSMEKTEGVGTRNAEAANTYTINTPNWQHQKSNVSQKAQEASDCGVLQRIHTLQQKGSWNDSILSHSSPKY